MRRIRASVMRLIGTFAGSRRERELAEELESHLQLHIDDNIRAGMPPAEARRQALLKFGAMEAIKEQHRDRGGYPVLSHLIQDLRFAARLLRKAPGFSVTAIVTIALAVGVNAAIFTVLNAAALQALPVPDGDRLATLAISFEGEGRRGVHGSASMLSYPEYEAVRDQSRAFEGVLAFSPFNPVTLGGAEPRSVLATLASCNYFDVLRIRTALGRGLTGRDCAPGSPGTMVLSDRLWRAAFAADPAVVGRSVTLNRAPFLVVGVAQAGFTGTQLVPEDVFVPVTLQKTIDRERELLDNAGMSWLVVMGRMKPDASLASVRSDLAVVAARLTTTLPPGRTAHLAADRSTLSTLPEIRTIVLAIGGVILAAVALVLLMACANIANLLLARASARRREIAVRMALGAGRGRLVQQLLTESLLLAAIGGAAGFLAATWTSRTVVRFLLGHLPPGTWPMVFDPRPDWRVALYAVGLTTLTGLAFGLVPALQSTRRDLGVEFRDVTATDRRGSRRLQNTLVTLQVAVCLILLLSAGLLARGLYRAQTLDPGINMSDVTVVAYDLPNAGIHGRGRGGVPAAGHRSARGHARCAGRRAEQRHAAERSAHRDRVRLSGHGPFQAFRVQLGDAVVFRRPPHPHRPRTQLHGRRSRVGARADRHGVDGTPAVAGRRSARAGADARQDRSPRRRRRPRRAGVAAGADRQLVPLPAGGPGLADAGAAARRGHGVRAVRRADPGGRRRAWIRSSRWR